MRRIGSVNFGGVQQGIKRFGPSFRPDMGASSTNVGAAVLSRTSAGSQHSLGQGLGQSAAARILAKYEYDFDRDDVATMAPMEESATVNPRVIVNRVVVNLAQTFFHDPHITMPAPQEMLFVARDTGPNGGPWTPHCMEGQSTAFASADTTETVLAVDAVSLNAMLLQSQIDWHKSGGAPPYATASDMWYGSDAPLTSTTSYDGFALDGIVRYRDVSADMVRSAGSIASVARYGQTDVNNIWGANNLAVGGRVSMVLTVFTRKEMNINHDNEVTYTLRCTQMADDRRSAAKRKTITMPEGLETVYQLAPLLMRPGVTMYETLALMYDDDRDALNRILGNALYLDVGEIFSTVRRYSPVVKPAKLRPCMDGSIPSTADYITLIVDIDDGLGNLYSVPKRASADDDGPIGDGDGYGATRDDMDVGTPDTDMLTASFPVSVPRTLIPTVHGSSPLSRPHASTASMAGKGVRTSKSPLVEVIDALSSSYDVHEDSSAISSSHGFAPSPTLPPPSGGDAMDVDDDDLFASPPKPGVGGVSSSDWLTTKGKKGGGKSRGESAKRSSPPIDMHTPTAASATPSDGEVGGSKSSAPSDGEGDFFHDAPDSDDLGSPVTTGSPPLPKPVAASLYKGPYSFGGASSESIGGSSLPDTTKPTGSTPLSKALSSTAPGTTAHSIDSPASRGRSRSSSLASSSVPPRSDKGKSSDETAKTTDTPVPESARK